MDKRAVGDNHSQRATSTDVLIIYIVIGYIMIRSSNLM